MMISTQTQRVPVYIHDNRNVLRNRLANSQSDFYMLIFLHGQELYNVHS